MGLAFLNFIMGSSILEPKQDTQYAEGAPYLTLFTGSWPFLTQFIDYMCMKYDSGYLFTKYASLYKINCSNIVGGRWSKV